LKNHDVRMKTTGMPIRPPCSAMLRIAEKTRKRR
jgi:hypothetical protein